ncbi:MAG TPA: hypothetical protein VG963_11960, partial [Polyangiaceae bacterium]|nr:hypothetical protein [Polyangiaceae bacterium]
MGRLSLVLRDFPLHSLPTLEVHHVEGRLSGTAHVVGWGKNARLDLDLSSNDLAVSDRTIGHLEAKLSGTADALRLGAQIQGPGGDLTARLEAPWQWGGRLVPRPAGQLQGKIETRDFQLSSLLPLVDGSISELAGRLDAHFSATLEGDQTRLSGEATLAQGVINLAALGQRFHDITAKIALTQQELRLEELRARGLTGALEAQATAQL